MPAGLRAFCINGQRLFIVLAISFLFLAPALANELSADRQSVQLTESVTITIALENEFAGADIRRLPARNLTIEGRPSVSTELSWINGVLTRRKVFRFRATPIVPGAAVAGPLTIVGRDGQQETLPAVSILVLPDVAAGTNDATTILRALLATGREPFFVVAETDRTEAFVGEEIVVTWTLYNSSSVQRWQIGRVPKLEDFWSEELEVRAERPDQAVVDGYVMHKVAIRRVALFPLRSGELTVGSTEVEAAILRRLDTGPFGLFEGNVVETRFASAPVTIAVKPLPAAARIDAVGTISMHCLPGKQRLGGPVVIEASLSGRANLRAAAAPRWRAPVAGRTEIIDAGVKVERRIDGASMTRHWKYLVFPAQSGMLNLPGLTLDVFDPVSARVEAVHCDIPPLLVRPAAEEGASSTPPAPRDWRATVRRNLPATMGVVAGIAILGVMLPGVLRRARVDHEVRGLLALADPASLREQVDEALRKRGLDPAELEAASSDRGDAYRAFRSIVDSVERDRITAGEAAEAIEQRLRDLLA